MKKITLTLLGLVAISTSALAQQEVKFGPKAGVNFATVNGKDSEGAKMLTGFHVGAFAEIKFNDKFAIQPEILYSAQGAKGKDEGIEVKTKYDYINVPIMAKYYVVDNLAIEAGPYVGFLMKAEAESGSESLDLKDYTKSVDFGIGAGVSFNLDNGFFVGARYNLGFAKIPEKSEAEILPGVTLSSEAADVKNGVIQISVGYKF